MRAQTDAFTSCRSESQIRDHEMSDSQSGGCMSSYHHAAEFGCEQRPIKQLLSLEDCIAINEVAASYIHESRSTSWLRVL